VLVQDALAQFPQETNLRVRLNPADHALLAGDPSYPEINWVADARIVRGGCVVEGRERIIDGRVDLALEQIFRKLSGTDA
jgi:flagellar biosynthesis/type III secretory pathway protein FliH